MARKHSSKTATQESIKNSEPRVISYRNWQGVNYVDAPLTWEPLETAAGKTRQTDLPNNFLMVQNNLETSEAGGLETRMDSLLVGTAPSVNIQGVTYQTSFTGVATVHRRWLFCAVRIHREASAILELIAYRPLTSQSEADWSFIKMINPITTAIQQSISTLVQSGASSEIKIEEIALFENYLIVTGVSTAIIDGSVSNVPCMLVAKTAFPSDANITIKGYNSLTRSWNLSDYACGIPTVSNPMWADFTLTAKNMHSSSSDADPDAPVRIQVCRTYTTIFGSTMAGPSASDVKLQTIYVEYSPALWSNSRYLTITPSGNYDTNITDGSPINGVDLYARENENTDWVFIGHVSDLQQRTIGGVRHFTWQYDWYGAMTDIGIWKNSSLMLPEENTTASPAVSHVSCHDSRLYYWGGKSKPYRLYIGGNPGNELSISRGLGGAWIDIEAGSGYEIRGTAKWKTASGANIITIMCGHKNTSKVKRFNLVETNLSLSNEVQYKSYMYEEVSNVTGCNSRWGYGVFEDGLYSLNRYGLMLVTMASEYNSQMKNQKISGVIDPIFTERLGSRLKDSRMVYIDGVIYIVLSEDAGHPTEPTTLDNVILCYNLEKKAWYTFTHDEVLTNNDTDHILGLIHIDSDEAWEGLGAITENQVRLYPTTGIQQPTVPNFQVLMETGELIPRMPTQAFWYIQQLEFRFDYFIGNPNDPATILVEGVDYYGRQFRIEKRLNIQSRGHHGATGEQRAYIEWIRIDKMVESLRVRIKGKARFRLTHFNAKAYQQPDTIGTPYGFDAYDTYKNRKGQDHVIHHYIDDYNNLRRAVIA